MKSHITKGSVLDDLGFDMQEAENMKIRAALMRAIGEEMSRKKLTQAAAAKLLGISQPRISDLKRGKIHLFTIDCLVGLLSKLGKPVHLVIDDRLAA
ncbi:MAG: XRE family transcriptional regulator [Legionellales bacterium]|nr:XRE family transcriptional regulator [Legionellales bacterium]